MPITLTNNQAYTNNSGVAITGTNAVTWSGGGTAPGVVLDNYGAITGSTRGINANGSFATGNFTLHNYAGGTVNGGSDDAIRINPTGFTTGVLTIENAGTITGGTGGQAVDFGNITGANVTSFITNLATGLITAAGADVVRPGSHATVYNYGAITAGGTGNDGVDFQENVGGTLYNYAGGVITGTKHGVTGDAAVTVVNDGTLKGLLGSGVNLDTAPGVVSTITNNAGALITGNSSGATDGDGLDSDGPVIVYNHGTIEATGTSTGGSLTEALAIGGGQVFNYADGIITSVERAITVDDSDLGPAFAAFRLENAGLIVGQNGQAIDIKGAFADTILNSGAITGSISVGGGDDVVTLSGAGKVNGVIFGGDGADSLTGAAAADSLNGGAGLDRLFGGAGDDRLTGGADKDIFVYGAGANGADVVADFQLGLDKLQLLDGARVAGIRYGDFDGDGARDTLLTLGGAATGTITLLNISLFNNTILL